MGTETPKTYIMSALQNVLREIQTSNNLCDAALGKILNLCGGMTIPALSIMDKKLVHKFTCLDGRSVYQVEGANGNIYICLKDELYCNCLSYKNSVILKQTNFICKHLLAVLLASALRTHVEIVKDNDTLNRLLAFEL